MSELIEFTSAYNWEEKVFIDPGDISLIKRFTRERDLASYSQLVMKSGATIEVLGTPEQTAKSIQEWLIISEKYYTLRDLINHIRHVGIE